MSDGQLNVEERMKLNVEKINNNEINTMEDVIEIVGSGIVLEDKNAVKLVLASFINSQVGQQNFWVQLVGPPGGGKTQILEPLMGYNDTQTRDRCFEVSDMTSNTFATSFKGAKSLLDVANGGMIIYKDFTTLLGRVDGRTILIQMREIWDGAYFKRSGNNNDVNFRGKVGMIGGCTELIYQYESDMSAGGQRFLYYFLKQPDNETATRMAAKTSYFKKQYNHQLKEAYGQYLDKMIKKLRENGGIKWVEIPQKELNEIVKLSMFIAAGRTGVLTDDRGRHIHTPEKERGTRISGAISTLYTALVNIRQAETDWQDKDLMNNTLPKEDMEIIYQTALSSLPRRRYDVLIVLAKYSLGANIRAIADLVKLPSKAVGDTIKEMYSLGIVDKKVGPFGTDQWYLAAGVGEPLYEYLHLEKLKEGLFNQEEEEVFGNEDF